MTIPLHVFMRQLMSDYGEHCPQIELIFDNATNPQSNIGVMKHKAASCVALSEPFESTMPRTYHRSRISRSDMQTNCFDLSDHSKGISWWGGISPTDGNSSRFESGVPVTNNPTGPPVAPPRMMSPAITRTGKKGLSTTIHSSPSKEAMLRMCGDKYYKKCNERSMRLQGTTRTGLNDAVERALYICDSRTHVGLS
ncbi:hypothetical protein IV203_020741 [Nitzschia inconspicua]|uniref:Uncharacterized protein n=1 Tax=Nitzschia inconspicua TaxID=303405 RepID=A0A9K3KFL3_9STRA|nr:hypothetical protein IV203_021567 [Nitzschia inconspicua]KAG7342797.1 hypothetical protein IV203_020741 [Nitzschia inconspicua]